MRRAASKSTAASTRSARPRSYCKEAPKEGESLERIVVRSSIHQDATTIASLSSERHIVPPKASQLMAEQHGLFDGATQMLSDQAAYELASREAGSLMERLNLLATGELEPAPGAVRRWSSSDSTRIPTCRCWTKTATRSS
jgi:hypothetical protein